MLAPIITFLTISLTLGTTIAAENAQPGDSLYPIKEHVNEFVKSKVHLGVDSDLNLGGLLNIESKSNTEINK